MENKGLLRLPETWYVVVTESNKEVLEKWFKIKYPDYELYCKNVGIYKWKKGSKTIIGQSDDITDQSFDFGQEITFADFKRLVLGEKNADDYGVAGCDELEKYFYKINCDLSGGLENAIYFRGKGIWYDTSLLESKRQILPLQEYLKLIEPETMEKKENEIIIVKTWETVYFKTENATVELTLNHKEKTFDLQTAREEMVSFKSDTIDVARERLKCIESALDYAEKHLNQ